ncbi:hypothetical protein ACOBQB_10165 [Streptomyces sp. G5(2025)]|uniref:hypothetical protein n=1 Tax=Streptomyces sp. G5(2025) TaxID=3406628 RepID=UPI003C254EF6
MPISREYARSLFADLVQNATVPLDPDVLLYMPRLRQHGHVFFGDIAVRCYKHKARWTYDERDVRAAGQVLADLHVDLDDVVDVHLPAYRDIAERDPEERHRPCRVRAANSLWAMGASGTRALLPGHRAVYRMPGNPGPRSRRLGQGRWAGRGSVAPSVPAGALLNRRCRCVGPAGRAADRMPGGPGRCRADVARGEGLAGAGLAAGNGQRPAGAAARGTPTGQTAPVVGAPYGRDLAAEP